MSEPFAKGATLNFAVLAFKQLAGEARFDAGTSRLSEGAQRALRVPPAFSEWVSIAICREIYDYAFSLFAESPQLMQQSGRLAAQLALKSTYRIFVRALSPHLAIRGWPTIWAVITKAGGSGKIVEVDKHQATVAMSGLTVSSAVWHFISGLLLGLAEMSGGKECSSTITSGGATADHCTFLVRY
jgi:hypothetical protein